MLTTMLSGLETMSGKPAEEIWRSLATRMAGDQDQR
jgi:hypothetical protein